MGKLGTLWHYLLVLALASACGEADENSSKGTEAGANGDAATQAPLCGTGLPCALGSTCHWDSASDEDTACTCVNEHFVCEAYNTLPGATGPDALSNEQVECSLSGCQKGFGYGCNFDEGQCVTVVNCAQNTQNVYCEDGGAN